MLDPMEARNRARKLITTLREYLREQGLPLPDEDALLLETQLSEEILKVAASQNIRKYLRRHSTSVLGSIENTIKKIVEEMEATKADA